MKTLELKRRLGMAALITLLLACAFLFQSDRKASAETLNTVTWDGGGSTNNWSEAANWSGDILPGAGDDVVFNVTSTKNVNIDMSVTVDSIFIGSGYTGIITQFNVAAVQINGCIGRPCFRQDGGRYNGSTNTITLNSGGSGAFLLNGGIFDGGTGNISLVGTPSEFSLQGGTFISTNGNLTANGTMRFQGTSVFQPDAGTVTIAGVNSGSAMVVDSDHMTVNFNNLVFNNADGANFDVLTRALVAGNLTLNDGSIGPNGTTIEARGSVTIAPTFDGGLANLELANGSGPRTFTLPTGTVLPRLVVNDPNVTINTSGSGSLAFPHQLNLQQGTINQGNVNLVMGPRPGGGECYLQSGGTFNGSSNTISCNSNGFGTITMMGGTFNGGSGDIFLIGDPDNFHDFRLLGGAFKATSGNTVVGGTMRLQNEGTSFDPNGGTVTFMSPRTTDLVTDSFHPNIVFNNVTINLGPGVIFELLPEMVVNGNLILLDGQFTLFGSITAKGNVTIGPNFDGGAVPVTFGGNANQTFANNGGINPSGTWTINKPFGLVTAATNFNLQPTQSLNIVSGGLSLASGSNFTAGPLTIGPDGRFVASSAQTITLGGDILNSGLVNLHANGALCPTADSILLRSSAPGTRRNWSGPGVIRAINVDVQDMGGTTTVKVFNGTNTGNNNSNWTFDSSCLANVIHTPFDFDGDRKSDFAVFRPSAGIWFVNRSTLGGTGAKWGLNTDKLAPADFDGDGITDIAIWRESAQSQFFILQSSTATLRLESFGITGDDPTLVGDWDGDGKAEAAVYRNGPVGGQSFIFFRGSLNNPNGNITFVPWGIGGDVSVRGDFDGDGRMDAGIFRSSDLNWWIRRSSDSQVVIQHWGLVTDKRIEGDFDGDGKTDFAVFRPSDHFWYVLQSSNGQMRALPWGLSTDVPLQGDYDGDGRADFAVWRPSDGNFWILQSAGSQTSFKFGQSDDIPIASALVR